MKVRVLLASVIAGFLVVPAPAAAQGSWADRIKVKGDTRLRHETIDEDGEEERARMRFRVRLGMNADVNDNVKFVLRLATGVDNPVSANQTIDGGFSTKEFGVDQAYIDWKIRDGLNLYGGKMTNPLFKAGGAQHTWDNDLNPEGVALKYDDGGFFGVVGGFVAEERSSADDSLLFVTQLGYKFAAGDNASLTAGAGYFAYTDTIGNSPFYNGSPNGNSVDANGDYLNEYRNAEIFAQFDTRIGEWPLSVYAHATRNNEVDVQDTAYAFGAKVGSAKKQGDMQFSWTYMDVEADAVIGTFNDSNFGAGETDSKGHIFRGKYALREKIFLGGSLFINTVDEFRGTEHDYNRLQLDVEFKFN